MLAPYSRETLIKVINIVCAENKWMRTSHFVATQDWEQVLTEPFSDKHLLLVTCESDVPVGWCRLFPTDHPREGEVGIGILPFYRDQGRGTHLVHQAILWATERRFSRLVLTTRVDNHHAIHVFKKCGFEFTGVRDGIWLQMALHLHNFLDGSETID